MGLRDWFKFKKDGNDNLLNQAFYYLISAGQIAWVKRNPETYIRDGYTGNEHVFAAVRVILNKVKTVPFMLNQVTDEKSKLFYEQYSAKSDLNSRLRAEEYRMKALKEVEKHPLLDLLNTPNDYQTKSEFIESLFGFYKVLGEAFVYGIPISDGADKGKFQSLHVLPAHLTQPVFSGDYRFPIRGYKFCLGDTTVEIPAENVMHMKTWNPLWDNSGNQLRGFSPLEAGRKTLTRNEANQTAMTRSYINGGSAYLLSNDGEKPTSLNQTQIDLLNERIKQKIAGVDNYNTITATSGSVKATKIGESPADMKLIEADKADRIKIATLFGVDPILIGEKGASTYNNGEQAYKALVTNTILPDIIEFRDKLNGWLTPKYGKNLYIDMDSTIFPELQPDYERMMKIYGKPRLTENERRSIFKWDAISEPYMDKVLVEKNLTPLESLFDKSNQQQQGN